MTSSLTVLAMVDFEGVAQLFPVNERYVWLNCCGTTPAAAPMLDAVDSYLREYAEHGIYAPSFALPEVRGDIQRILADLLSVKPHEIALVKNTSEAMNLVSYGLGLEAGDEILLLEKEYPSNVYPWEH